VKPKLQNVPMNNCLLLVVSLLLGCSTSHVGDNSCTDETCWEPNFNFTLGDTSFREQMTFISGHIYALNATNQVLNQQNKNNFYCIDDENIRMRHVVNKLNAMLQGKVSAEELSYTIIVSVARLYPCVAP